MTNQPTHTTHKNIQQLRLNHETKTCINCHIAHGIKEITKKNLTTHGMHKTKNPENKYIKAKVLFIQKIIQQNQ